MLMILGASGALQKSEQNSRRRSSEHTDQNVDSFTEIFTHGVTLNLSTFYYQTLTRFSKLHVKWYSDIHYALIRLHQSIILYQWKTIRSNGMKSHTSTFTMYILTTIYHYYMTICLHPNRIVGARVNLWETTSWGILYSGFWYFKNFLVTTVCLNLWWL